MAKKKKYYPSTPAATTVTKPAAAVKDAAASDGTETFSLKRIKAKQTVWDNRYSDEASQARRRNRTPTAGGDLPTTADEVRELLEDALSSTKNLSQLSRKLYSVNPRYASIINYRSNRFLWRYKVTPHRAYSKSRVKNEHAISQDEFNSDYCLRLEAVDGLDLETKFPNLLRQLFINGAVYFTTVFNEEQVLIDTLLLPLDYCRKIGETQYGTNIIQFDRQYFDGLGLTTAELKEYLATFPDEIQKDYQKYKKDSTLRWQRLDPTYSSCLMANEYGVPSFFYLYGSILNYEKYQDNELERNDNLLKYIVVQKRPIYQDKLVFERDEVAALHNSMKQIIDRGDKSRLLTTYGDVNVQRIAEDESTQSDILAKALNSIYSNGGFNPTFFTGESVEALTRALIRDESYVWQFVQQLVIFFNLVINNYLKLKFYEADLEILRVSSYSYKDDIEIFKNNATLGVGKLDYLIASGTKQKNIQDTLDLEHYLHLDQITPRQTSYTQSTATTASDDADESSKTNVSTSGIEPPLAGTNSDNDDSDNTETDDADEGKEAAAEEDQSGSGANED